MSATTVFTGGQIVMPDRILERHQVVVRSGQISAIEPADETLPSDATVISLDGNLLTPGMVDIHIHGGGGADFMDATVEAARIVCQTHLRHGTTTLFPTTTTGTLEQIEAAFAACRQVQQQDKTANQAKIAGMHLYGPYFAEDKVGAHKKVYARAPEASEYNRYFQDDLVKVATCAAELPGAAAFYRAASAAGCLVTCGHSNSTFPEMADAFKNGMRHVDHFWSAMSSVTSLRPRCGTPMQAGMEQFVLLEPEMSTEVIADSEHLADELLNFAYRMKGVQRLCLVTDCSRALDMPIGRYIFGPIDDGDWFQFDGKVGRSVETGNLASSVAGMDRMVRNMVRAIGGNLVDAIRMATLTPAERTGTDDQIGSIAVGKQADLVVWSPDLEIQAVYLDGRLAHGCVPC